jgi:hypothetical protein
MRLVYGTAGVHTVSLAPLLSEIKPDVPIILFSGSVPENLNSVDVYVNKGEPTAKFLGIVRAVVQRYRS